MIVSNKRVTYGFCPLLSDLECFHRKLLRFLVEKSSFRRNIGTASSSIVIFPRRSECTFGGSVPHLSCPLLFCALRIRSDLAVFAAITLSRNGPQRGSDWRVGPPQGRVIRGAPRKIGGSGIPGPDPWTRGALWALK